MKSFILKCFSLFFLTLIISCKGYKAKYNELQDTHMQLLTEKNECFTELNYLKEECDNNLMAYDTTAVENAAEIENIREEVQIKNNELVELAELLETANNNYQELSSQYASELENFNQATDYSAMVEQQRSDSLDVIYQTVKKSYVSIACPSVMREEVQYNVHAMVSPLSSNENLKKDLLDVVNESREERQESLLTIEDLKSEEIILGNYIKIELKDYNNKFKIVIPEQYPDSETAVDLYDENSKNFRNEQFEWQWKVTPKENTYGKAYLKFIITPLDKDKNEMEFETREFKVDIDLKQSFVSSVWEKANRNPEWAIASIITPFLTFLAGFFAKRKKDERSNKLNNPDA